MSWIKIVEGKRTLKQELVFFGIVLLIILAFVGIVWGGILGWLAAGITFLLLSYIFWRINQKRSVSGTNTLRESVTEIRRNPNIVFQSAVKGFEQYMKPTPRPPDQEPISTGGPLSYAVLLIVILFFAILIGTVIIGGTHIVRVPLWAGFLPTAFIVFAIYCILFVPKKQRLVSVSDIRLLLALISFGIPMVIWFCLGLFAMAQILNSVRLWHFLALPGLFLPVVFISLPAYVTNRIRQRYIPFLEDSNELSDDANPFKGFFDRVKRWSQYLGIQSAPVSLLSTIKGMSPHLFGWRTVYLAVPPNLPEIMNRIRTEWPSQADALFDFMAIHELTHIVHRDHRPLMWLRTLSRYIFTHYIPVSLAFSFLGCLLFMRQEFWRLLLVVVMIMPFIISLYWMTFIHILFVNREREYLADQRAIEMIGSEKAALLRERKDDNSPMRTLFLLFSSKPGPALGEVLFNNASVDWMFSGKNRIRSLITKMFSQLTYTHPSEEKRENFLGHTYDVERLFSPREHGVVTGLAIAGIWFTFLLAFYALKYRDSITVDFLLFWICFTVLFGMIAVPLRHMKGRDVIPSKLFRHIWLSYAWSTVTATITIQAMAIIPMTIMGEWKILRIFLNQMILAHFFAVLLNMIFIPRLRELGLFRKSTNNKSLDE